MSFSGPDNFYLHSKPGNEKNSSYRGYYAVPFPFRWKISFNYSNRQMMLRAQPPVNWSHLQTAFKPFLTLS